jgi:ABC-type multidrug transport system fused ATPase/permease subunit
MLLILLIVLFAAVGVGLGVLFNKLVIKNFPENRRKGSYVKTVIVFLLITVVLFAAVYGKFIADAAVNNKTGEIEQDIIKNYSNLNFVRNGLDIGAVSKDVSKLNNTIGDIVTALNLKTKANEFGVPSFLYDMAMNSVRKELQKIIVKVSEDGKANSYLDEKNFLTVSSLMNGIRTGILKIIKITVFVIVAICVILLGIYILVSISTASKEKKRVKGKSTG